MSNKRTVKKFIKYFRKLRKDNFHGAAGYVQSKDGEVQNIEIAARYLSMKGEGVNIDTTISKNGRTSEISID